jgi:hypothetical protein
MNSWVTIPLTPRNGTGSVSAKMHRTEKLINII